MNSFIKISNFSGWRLLAQALLALALAQGCEQVLAQGVLVENAWARATVPGQKGGGVFMTLRAEHASRLVSVASSVAAFGEVHEMRQEGDVMKMRPLKDGLELPAGKAMELKPGSYHIMLMGLKTPLMVDSSIVLTLGFEDAQGVQSKTDVTVPVVAMTSMGHMH